MKVVNKSKRVLIFAEAATLSHVSRPYVLAQSLVDEGYDVHFACNARYGFLLEDSRLCYHNISSIETETFNKRLALGQPLYTTATLQDYAEEDRGIIRQVNPNIVLGDFRLSLAVSARLAKVPYASIVNAHWSPYTERKGFPVPEHPLTTLFGAKVISMLFPIIRPIAFKINLSTFKKFKMQNNLPAPKTLKEAYTDADYILYPELRSLVPTKQLPENHSYIGPILWAPSSPLPDWTNSGEGKRIFLNLGTSGDISTLRTTISVLSKLNLRILVATAGRTELKDLPENVHAQPYVDGIAAAKWADLIISNGGSGSVYQGLAAGVPTLGICSNMDQFLNMENLCDRRAGMIIRPSELTEALLRSAVLELLNKEEYLFAAKILQSDFSKQNSNVEIIRFIERACDKTEVASNGNALKVSRYRPQTALSIAH